MRHRKHGAMINLLKMADSPSRRWFVLTFSIMLALLTGASKAAGQCGCMDVALIVDDSGSMGAAIANVGEELPAIITAAQAASGGDVRFGLVTFPASGATAGENVAVKQAFTTDGTLIQNAVAALAAGGGAGAPEPSDAALQFVVTGAAESECTVSNAPLGSFRSECVKIAVLITDELPGGCHDTFTVGVDDVHARTVANLAASAGVLVSAIYVPTFIEDPQVRAIMEDYADITGGVFVQTEADGTGTADGISDIVAACGSVGSTQVITRTSRFWFTHAYSTNDNTCATLLKATQLGGGRLNLGFVSLPVANRTADNVTDANDALIEALSLYWRNAGKTGEDGGLQNQNLKGSSLCKARKELAVELTAAIANNRLLGTKPSNATYFDGLTVTNFPANLIPQARTAASSDDVGTVRSMTALLKKFNSSGVTNNLPSGLVECSIQKSKDLRKLSRDPTTQITCPGVATVCDSAEAVVFPNSGDPFANAVFTRSVNLSKVIGSVQGPSCGAGGRDAVWQVKPAVGTDGRQFTVTTDGSNFDTMISAWTGACSNLVEVTGGCADNVFGTGGEQLSFTTDGTSTYRIVVEGASGQYGKLKVKITSP
jgi:hypothetical protein